MAYADQKMSTNKMVALIIVAILHVLVGYALVTGLPYSAVKKLKERVETFDVEEESPRRRRRGRGGRRPRPPPPGKAGSARRRSSRRRRRSASRRRPRRSRRWPS